MTIRVLIVDNSPTMRAILMSRLTAENDIAVITLDIEMPGMNGLDFLEKIMALRPTPVIIVSGATQQGNEVTARALALGAVGILLTGMGSDGAKGLLEMAQVGTFTIAQDEATCTVFGMPRVAISLGAANLVAPIDRIASHALQMAA